MKRIIFIICMLLTNYLPAQVRLYPYLIDNYFVYVNESNKITIPTKFDQAFPFQGKLAKVKLNGKYGVIDIKGKWILDPKFDDLTISSSSKSIQIIEAGVGYNAWYNIHKWKLLPNLNILGKSSGPFVRAKVPKAHWRVYDTNGKEIASKNVSCSSYYKDVDIDNIVGSSPFKWTITNKLFLYTDNNTVRLYELKRNKLKYSKTLRKVVYLYNESFFSGTNSKIQYHELNNKVHENEYSFYRFAIPNTNSSDCIWLSNTNKYYIINNSFGVVEIPKRVLDLGANLIYPIINNKTNLFWINRSSEFDEVGIVDNQGEWVFRGDSIKLEYIYEDGSGVFKNMNKKQYYIFDNQIKIHEMPENIIPNSRVNSSSWIVLRYMDDMRYYGVYDIHKKDWIIKLQERYLTEISSQYFSYEQKIFYNTSSYHLKYGVLDASGKEITSGDYSSLRTTSNEDLIYVRERESQQYFYVKVQTGEELRLIK